MNASLWIRAFTIFFLALPLTISAQSKKELEQQRKALNEKINLTSKLISKNQSTAKKQQSELVILDRQIEFRNDLINTIHEEVEKLQIQIKEKEDSLSVKEKELKKLKDDYADLIRHAYKTRNIQNKMMFIFASRSINQAYNRINYLRRLAEYRRSQAEKIEAKKNEIVRDLSILAAKKDEKEILLSSQQVEKSRLLSDKTYKDQTLKSIEKETGKLRKELREQERRKEQIAKQIERLIAAEIAENRKKSSTGKFTLSPEATALSSNFESNKGKLPWPVEKGIITRKFGRQPHPYVSGVYINNDGLNFNTEKNAEVRAVFRGTVSSILLIPGEGKVVVVKHGAYRTVYTKLQNVTVKKDQEVSTGSVLGTAIGVDDSSSETHIEIWKISETERKKLDPAAWLIGI
ncbi:murein hydrolase activator EnvC family protein [Luteibaculum oceani]|uniref:Peptidoglycan DD-metalloendopeptidase family protein n=1 Tax=Luteibaculum oceani TaxID=1294296 RepID=A0A5C6VK17_9FLAO|nr:peptidoglycan DD-metalloendopeptidase family protein [Luteibaculum oceani]TXC85299.1 peptidoglycan DD-metalloendopeptidase family protein [Luteibaculum oceani]